MDKYFAPMLKKFTQFFISCQSLLSSFYDYLLFQINPFLHHLVYYLLVSLLGFFSLKLAKQRTASPLSAPIDDLDLFFTSVSATTISSMSTVNMEHFSSTQLVILVFLMLSGGEVFISLLGLYLRKSKHRKREKQSTLDAPDAGMKYRSLKALGHVVWGYLLTSHVIGYTLISLYISIVPSASKVLEKKRIEMHLFSIFLTVSTFSNCGFVPTNENMMAFKKNSGLLLILIPQILLGNKLFPCCLRLVIWALEKLTKKPELNYILENSEKMGCSLLVSKLNAVLLAVTAVALVALQFVVFCLLEWNSVMLMGMNWYQKLVASLFQTANSRHSGESIVDLSLISPATLVLFVVMMYLPSSTAFVPIEYDKESSAAATGNHRSKPQKSDSVFENLKFSQLSYLAIFVMLICFSERVNIRQDPLNFNVFNIIVEVVSAYGNVGFSMGYSCDRKLGNREHCRDAWYGFAGRWTRPGKVLLIIVMFFGRLKRFNFNGGKAWKLSL